MTGSSYGPISCRLEKLRQDKHIRKQQETRARVRIFVYDTLFFGFVFEDIVQPLISDSEGKGIPLYSISLLGLYIFLNKLSVHIWSLPDHAPALLFILSYMDLSCRIYHRRLHAWNVAGQSTQVPSIDVVPLNKVDIWGCFVIQRLDFISKDSFLNSQDSRLIKDSPKERSSLAQGV